MHFASPAEEGEVPVLYYLGVEQFELIKNT